MVDLRIFLGLPVVVVVINSRKRKEGGRVMEVHMWYLTVLSQPHLKTSSYFPRVPGTYYV